MKTALEKIVDLQIEAINSFKNQFLNLLKEEKMSFPIHISSLTLEATKKDIKDFWGTATIDMSLQDNNSYATAALTNEDNFEFNTVYIPWERLMTSSIIDHPEKDKQYLDLN